MNLGDWSIQSTQWHGATALNPRNWQCGYCGQHVASNQGYKNLAVGSSTIVAEIVICGYCGGPTLFLPGGRHSPIAPPGEDVPNIPADLLTLYREARDSASQGAHTAAVMVCRKILMHVAVAQNADANQQFAIYVQYLRDKGYLPPGAEQWVDYIRSRANEANHEIVLMDQRDSTALIGLVEMLLRFIYELPALVPQQTPEGTTSGS